jgi:hypothetical protein
VETTAALAATHVYSAKDHKRLFGAKPQIAVTAAARDTGGALGTSVLVLAAPVAAPPPAPKPPKTCLDAADADCWVTRVHLALFGRKPKGSEMAAALLGDLSVEEARAPYVAGLLDRTDYRTARVRDAYVAVLRRNPSKAELTGALAALAAGEEVETLRGHLLGSTEYVEGRAENSDVLWTDAMCRTLFGRAAGPDDYAAVSQAIFADGRTFEQVGVEFATSLEAATDFVQDTYLQLLRRTATVKELGLLTAQAQDFDAALASVLASEEYFANAPGAPKPPTGTKTERFVDRVYRDLLGRPVDPGARLFWTPLLDAGQVSGPQFARAVLASTEQRIAATHRLYRTYLDRDADTAALQLFPAQLAAGTTLQQLRRVLLASGEYYATRGGSTNAGFVTALFDDVLGRAPSQLEMTWLEGQLLAGTTRDQVAAFVLQTPDAMRRLVQQIYQRFLRRPADHLALIHFTQILQDGANEDHVVAAIVGSAEYVAALPPGVKGGLAPKAYVAALYQQVLGRAPTAQELAPTLALLGTPNGRAKVAFAMELSTEARVRRVTGWYQTYLGRAPTTQDPLFVQAGTLGTTGTEESVTAAILASPEYFLRTPAITSLPGSESPGMFVQAVHLQLLGRVPSAPELAFFTPIAKNGAGRGAVATTVLASAEARGLVASALFVELLGRAATAAELQEILLSPLTAKELRIQLAASAEYYARVTK